MFVCNILSFFRRLSCLVRASLSLARVVVISFNISSLISQMEPFSPILKHTSLGSIHTVNSSGKPLNSAFDTPVRWAASRITGSIAEWLIRIHRNPLPNKGFCGCQCVLYRSHRISSIFNVNFCSLGSLMWWFLLNINKRNLHPLLTSLFMATLTVSRNVRCRYFQFSFRAGRVVVVLLVQYFRLKSWLFASYLYHLQAWPRNLSCLHDEIFFSWKSNEIFVKQWLQSHQLLCFRAIFFCVEIICCVW